jgi:phosphopantothenoylcysteine decarboxylase/phosphopantothenate--cysteine ligase
MVANLVSDAMGDDDNTVTLLDKNGAHPLERAPKSVIANLLLKHVVSLL